MVQFKRQPSYQYEQMQWANRINKIKINAKLTTLTIRRGEYGALIGDNLTTSSLLPNNIGGRARGVGLGNVQV
jgi:hypothetical protein